jgi:hypothetical protein
METRIFISETNKGWEKFDLPENFKRYSHDALVSVVHKFLNVSKYKGVLITENPNPF